MIKLRVIAFMFAVCMMADSCLHANQFLRVFARKAPAFSRSLRSNIKLQNEHPTSTAHFFRQVRLNRPSCYIQFSSLVLGLKQRLTIFLDRFSQMYNDSFSSEKSVDYSTPLYSVMEGVSETPVQEPAVTQKESEKYEVRTKSTEKQKNVSLEVEQARLFLHDFYEEHAIHLPDSCAVEHVKHLSFEQQDALVAHVYKRLIDEKDQNSFKVLAMVVHQCDKIETCYPDLAAFFKKYALQEKTDPTTFFNDFRNNLSGLEEKLPKRLYEVNEENKWVVGKKLLNPFSSYGIELQKKF